MFGINPIETEAGADGRLVTVRNAVPNVVIMKIVITAVRTALENFCKGVLAGHVGVVEPEIRWKSPFLYKHLLGYLASLKSLLGSPATAVNPLDHQNLSRRTLQFLSL